MSSPLSISFPPSSLPSPIADLFTSASNADELASLIMQQKRLLVDLDKRRQQIREAIGHFRPKNVVKYHQLLSKYNVIDGMNIKKNIPTDVSITPPLSFGFENEISENKNQISLSSHPYKILVGSTDSSFFVSMSPSQCEKYLQSDSDTIESSINSTRNSIKSLVGEMSQMVQSEMDEKLIRFVLREKKKIQEGKEEIIDQEDEQMFSTESEQQGDEDGLSV